VNGPTETEGQRQLRFLSKVKDEADLSTRRIDVHDGHLVGDVG
jgi:hypothetical protein